jgi:cell wall-associated NlpC family hydrolase
MLACLQAEGAVSAVSGVVLGPDGCPTSVPQNTLRQGAIELDIHALCVKSVSAAATPEAKKALLFLFANLGTPYSVQLRDQPGFFDCSSYAMRAYNSAGLRLGTPSSRTLGPAVGWTSVPWLRDVTAATIKPGDLLVRIPDAGHHVMVLLADGWMIHTGGPEGAPAHITKLPDDYAALKKRRVIPALAPGWQG